MNLLDIFEGREPYQQAIDKLEQRRIEDLEAKMDDYAKRGMKDEFQKCKAERDSYYKTKNEGYDSPLDAPDAVAAREKLQKAMAPVKAKHPNHPALRNFKSDVEEAGIGQDLVNKTEKMARATPQSKAGAVASTVKNAAKWLAGKGGPGKEGPTYEGTETQWSKESDWKEVPKSKSGKPVDPRGEVTHLSDVARREAERKADQKKKSEEVEEGFQDFNKVEPYAVCLAGKPVKKFDYYEQARRFHDNWKQKLYREGDMAKAEKITLMPLNLDEQGVEENLKKWFKEKWVRFGPDGKIRGDCARGSDTEGKPKCLPQSKAHALGKKGRASSAAKKRREDPNPERRGAAKNVATKVKEDELDEACWKGYHKEGNKELFGKTVPNCVKNEAVAEGHESCPECGGAMYPDTMINEKQDACYYKVKSRYKVWPSAYASGALVQCRKKGAANWGNKSESAEQELDEKWSQKYKSSINCSNPKGFSQKAHCAGKKKNEDSYTGIMESQGITDAKLLEVARKIDLFAKDFK